MLELLLSLAAAHGQVLAPEEIQDSQIRALQQRYWNELKMITRSAAAHQFPYHFYFSRKLDVPEAEQAQIDQRSVQFDRYRNRVVLKITGNYFASYSSELMKPEDRARQTYEAVMLPLLRAAVQALDTADVPEAFAFEISHHLRKKMLGVSSEGVENVVLLILRDSARRLVTSADSRLRDVAMLDAEVFLNAKPISLWPRPADAATGTVARRTPAPEVSAAPLPAPVAATSARPPATAAVLPEVSAPRAASPAVLPARPGESSTFTNLVAKVAPERIEEAVPARGNAAGGMNDLQKTYQPVLDKMVRELDPQGHFVSYAPPFFIPFHNGVYLQVSVTTTIPQAQAGSQYRQAALAFDGHIAHLIRPVLAYFKEKHEGFDGIDFSTTMKLSSNGQDGAGSTLAVEFISPLKVLSDYAEFDCTGQQLIDASFVLINGERISLNLQTAENDSPVR